MASAYSLTQVGVGPQEEAQAGVWHRQGCGTGIGPSRQFWASIMGEEAPLVCNASCVPAGGVPAHSFPTPVGTWLVTSP
jgi:hypothetical protein